MLAIPLSISFAQFTQSAVLRMHRLRKRSYIPWSDDGIYLSDNWSVRSIGYDLYHTLFGWYVLLSDTKATSELYTCCYLLLCFFYKEEFYFENPAKNI